MEDGCVSITPLQLDLTDRHRLDELARWDWS
jgi:broad specificity polyphosphatase/5'/3'-nucleotidase SurE